MLICRKCQQKFPYTIKLDGKIRNLGSRKFCLNCSPFNSRNTKPDDPSRPSKKPLKTKYKDWSEEVKFTSKAQQYYYRQRKMLEIIQYKGGKCEKCGYDKCTRALTFHHKNPETKSFGITSRSIQSKTIKMIYEEADKCELLCFNCHMEHHYNEQISKYAHYIKEKYDFEK